MISENIPVREDYSDLVRRFFQSQIEKVDFSDDPEAVRRGFNERVSNFTSGIIREALSEGKIEYCFANQHAVISSSITVRLTVSRSIDGLVKYLIFQRDVVETIPQD